MSLYYILKGGIKIEIVLRGGGLSPHYIVTLYAIHIKNHCHFYLFVERSNVFVLRFEGESSRVKDKAGRHHGQLAETE